MEFSAKQIAQLLQGVVEGNEEVIVNKLCKIEEGEQGGLSFLANPNIPCNNLHCPIHYLTNRRKNGRKSTLYQTTLCTILRRYNPNRHRRKNTLRTHRFLKNV